VQQRATGMSAAVDRTIAKEKEDLTIDSPEELINQKSEEALSVAQKWSAQLEQKSSSINEEEIAAILQEATADLEYWNDQKKKISSWLSEDGSEETKVADLAKGALFLQLSIAASKAIKQAYNVAEFYGSLSDDDERTRTAPVLHVPLFRSSNPLYTGDAGRIRKFISQKKTPAGQLPLEIRNPLNAGQASDSRSQQLGQLENNKTKVIKIPSKLSPLIADTLQEVLETWSGDAEIRYDFSNRKYVSEQFQPNNMLDAMRHAAGRSSLERQQNRYVIEQVALEGRLDRSARFKNHFSIRVRNTLGEPLTPDLIKKVNKDLRREDRTSARDAIIYPSGLSTFGRFLEVIAARWEAFRSRGRDRSGYATIPSDYVEVKSEIIHHRQVHSGSYQALQPGSLDASNGNRDSKEK
ncbi:MAG: hypothetical protein WCO92_06160, partial [Verrucomicrobiota bacterium]